MDKMEHILRAEWRRTQYRAWAHSNRYDFIRVDYKTEKLCSDKRRSLTTTLAATLPCAEPVLLGDFLSPARWNALLARDAELGRISAAQALERRQPRPHFGTLEDADKNQLLEGCEEIPDPDREKWRDIRQRGDELFRDLGWPVTDASVKSTSGRSICSG